MRLLPLMFITIVACENDIKGEQPDPWNDPIEGDYDIPRIVCPNQPAERRHHQMAYYFSPYPMYYAFGRRTEVRGVRR